MDGFEQHYYKANEILMSSIGQWPYQTRCASRSFLGITLFLYTSQILPEIMALVKYRNDPEIILECISPLLFVITALTKLITCIANSGKMSKLMNRINEDWKTWARDREVRILHEYAETGRKMTVAYAVSIYSTGILFLTQPILPKIIDVLFHNGTEPEVFPFPVYYYFFDERNYYFYIIGSNYVGTSMNLIITIASDTMFIVYVQHACGIFNALGQNLGRIEENEKSLDGRDMEFEHLTTCIDRHNDAIDVITHGVPRFSKLIEATYSGCFFFLVGCNTIIISLTGLQIITKTNEPQDTIRYIAFVGAQLVHLFIFSYFSQILIDHSTSIRHYIHSAKWYEISLKSQKLMNLMSMRCNESCKLTAGKISVMSIEMFGAVIKTSMSYLTLLSSLQ